MKIAVASDHRGFDAKRKLVPLLMKMQHEVIDLGCDGTAAVDYPEFAVAVARGVASGEYEMGILLDGNGIGMTIVANKIDGIRAGLVHDEVTARHAREQNHCNVLCMGADLLGEDQIRKIIENFLANVPAEGRHQRRVEKITEIERQREGAGSNPKI